MRGYEAPQRQAHLIEPARSADYAKQQAIEEHHVQRSQSQGNAHGKGHKRDRQIVGHNRAAGDRLQSDHRVRPHLVMLNRFHHLGPKHLKLEIWVVKGGHKSSDRASEKNDQSYEDVTQVALKNFGEGSRKESQDIERAAPPANVDGIVNACEQLVQVASVMLSTLVLTQDRQIRGDLPIEQTKAAQLTTI